MYLRKIEDIPHRYSRTTNRSNNRLRTVVTDFYESREDQIEILFDPGEYCSPYSLCSGLKKAAASMELPVQAKVTHGRVFLVRDWE